MKLHLPSLLRSALLACLACSSSLYADSFLAEGVNATNLSSSERFYDGGKGLYWSDAAIESGARRLFTSSGKSYAYLGELYDRYIKAEYQGAQDSFNPGAFSPLKNDADTCWAYTSSNVIQYWQTYYGVFSSRAAELPYGHTYATGNLVALGGTQSLELNMAFYDNWENKAGNMDNALAWYMGGQVLDGGLIKPDHVSGGYFAEYFPQMTNLRAENTYISTSRIFGDTDWETFSAALKSGLGFESGDTDTPPTKGQIAYLGLTDAKGDYGHAITCYGFETDASGNVTSLKVTNSDDKTYSLFTLYVNKVGGRYMLYTDAACTKLWVYGNLYQNWYIDEISAIRTPDSLKAMYAEYADKDKTLYWNEQAATWGGSAGKANMECLPTASTGWEAVAGTDTEYMGYYAAYADSSRAVVFDDNAAGGTSSISLAGNVSAAGMAVDNSALAYTFNGSGRSLTTPSLSKSGTSTLTFKGVKLSATQTMVENGWLLLGSGTTLSGSTTTISPSDTAELAGMRFCGGSATLTSITVREGGVLDFSAATTLSVGRITLEESSTLAMTLGAANAANAILTQSGNLVIEGAITLTLSASTLNASDRYLLAQSSGGISLASPGNVCVLGGNFERSGYTAELNLSADKRSLLLSFIDAPVYEWAGGSGVWDKQSDKWLRGAESCVYDDSRSVYARFEGDTDAEITITENVSAATLILSDGCYEFANAQGAGLTVTNGMRLQRCAHVTMANAPTFAANAALAVEDAASSLRISSGDVSLRTFSNMGSVTLGNGSLSIATAVKHGGTLSVSGTLSLAAATQNNFVNLSAGTLALGSGSSLRVSAELGVSALSLASLSASVAVTAGTLASAPLDFLLTETARKDLESMKMGNYDTVGLLRASDLGGASFTISGGERLTLGEYDYIIGTQSNLVVLTAMLSGYTPWESGSSTDGWNDDTKVGLFGKGSETVSLSGDKQVESVVVETLPGSTYTLAGSHELAAVSVELRRGGLIVAQGTTMQATSLKLDSGADFHNEGTTRADTISAESSEIRNNGTLCAGNGSVIGSLFGTGAFVSSGNVAVLKGAELGSLRIDSGSLRVAGDADIRGEFRSSGTVRANKLTFARPVAAGGKVEASEISFAASDNHFDAVTTSLIRANWGVGLSPVIDTRVFYLPRSGCEIDLLNITLPGVANATGVSFSMPLITSDIMESSASGGDSAAVRATSEGASASGSGFTLSRETQLAIRKGHASGALQLEGGNLTLVLTPGEATFYENTSLSGNGRSGGALLDKLLDGLDPQSDRTAYRDLSGLMDALDAAIMSGHTAQQETLCAAAAGASIPALGMACAGDVSRQLRSIRNRAASLGSVPGGANSDESRLHAWIHAEGDYRSVEEDGTASGFTLNSWGGTVGADYRAAEGLAFGLACSVLYGDFSASGVDMAEGDLDTYYASLFARWEKKRWSHTLVLTAGTADMSLERLVNYGSGSYSASGTADASSWGLLYELAYKLEPAEDASFSWQPVANISCVQASVDAYSESGSDAALTAAGQDYTLISFGLGARARAIVGESVYNRRSLLELRALLKVDAGDLAGEADVAFAALPGATARLESAELGSVGVELGAGISIPVSADAGDIFVDASAELRSGSTAVNAAAGWRFHF